MRGFTSVYKKRPVFVEAFQFTRYPEYPNPQWFIKAIQDGVIVARGWKNFLIGNGQEHEFFSGDYIVYENGRVLVYTGKEFDNLYMMCNIEE